MLILSTAANANKSLWSLIVQLYELDPLLVIFSAFFGVIIIILGIMALWGAIKIGEDPSSGGPPYGTPWG